MKQNEVRDQIEKKKTNRLSKRGKLLQNEQKNEGQNKIRKTDEQFHKNTKIHFLKPQHG